MLVLTTEAYLVRVVLAGIGHLTGAETAGGQIPARLAELLGQGEQGGCSVQAGSM